MSRVLTNPHRNLSFQEGMIVRPNRISISTAAAVATLIAGMMPVLAAPGPSQMPTHTLSEESCVRDLAGVEWFFDPCVPEGYPLPPDVVAGMEEDRIAR